MNETKTRSTSHNHTITESDHTLLLNWFEKNHRQLPWRENRDPYRIWISETMLQQTTTKAVLGFYDRFLQRFPTVKDLAQASVEEVYEVWAGLGYYSRARNLHKAAQQLLTMGGFAKSHRELMELPGFGPYTSRAVSSLAFSEPVGVLDGNVIRVLTRKFNLKWAWWQTRERQLLQMMSDEFALMGSSDRINQALMELGSQICTPKKPHCQLCPWLKTCGAFQKQTQNSIPLQRPRKKTETWIWSPHVEIKNQKVRLIKNDYAPFLKGSWLLPGQAKMSERRPERYDLRHTITNHEIYVHIRNKKAKIDKFKASKTQRRWVAFDELKKFVPNSLVRKTIEYVVQKTSNKNVVHHNLAHGERRLQNRRASKKSAPTVTD
jgi:A/G-specific adenine glycosylase